MTRITVRVRNPPELLAVSLDDRRLAMEAGGAEVELSPGFHVLAIEASDAPGAAFRVSIDGPPELEWSEEVVVPGDGRVAVQHRFHVGGGRGTPGEPGSGSYRGQVEETSDERGDEDDWPGPRNSGDRGRDA